ncbi:hypothetical protein SLE2022_306390 [Rubroshorea leprosula]
MAIHEGQICFSLMEFPTMASMLMVVRTAIELRVFDIIADAGPEAQLSATEIVSYIPTCNPKAAERLDRMLGLLSASGFLINTSPRQSHDGTRSERTYSLSKMSHYLLRNSEGFSIAAAMLFVTSREIFESFYVLKDAVLEEGFQDYFTKAHAMTLYEYTARYPNFAQIFDEAMASFSKSLVLDGLFNVYEGLKDVTELMDVGGGYGTTLQHILTLNPNIRGINFDLPQVIDSAPKIPGVEHVAGDMFQSLPKAESIVMKTILHNWDDDKCKMLLKNCWDALPNNGKLIILEFIVPEMIENTPESQLTMSVDIQMLTLFGTKERTLLEYEGLAKSAGFLGPNDFPTMHGYHILEFFKTVVERA